MALVLTPHDLYRAGKKNTGPRFEHFSTVIPEIVVQNRAGVDWVLGPRQGGASTVISPMQLNNVVWYVLPIGTKYDDAVFDLWSDYQGHWSWEPARDMRLSDYLDALRALNPEFIRV
jgi:hypothetical protein